MSDPYSRNIFSVELAQVLKEHKLDLSALTRKPLVFSERTVKRLNVSLSHLKPLAALNQIEIMELVKGLGLTNDEYLRIYAALIALGVQRLMLDYLTPARAWEIADEVRREVLKAQYRNPTLSIKFLTRRINRLYLLQESNPSTENEASSPLSDPLTDALDSYDEGMMLATLGALEANVDEGRMQIELAQLHLQRTQQLLVKLPASVRQTDEWMYWDEQVQKQLQLIEEAIE